jgi:hypothetical protein
MSWSDAELDDRIDYIVVVAMTIAAYRRWLGDGRQ